MLNKEKNFVDKYLEYEILNAWYLIWHLQNNATRYSVILNITRVIIILINNLYDVWWKWSSIFLYVFR